MVSIASLPKSVEDVLNCRVTTTMIDRGIPRHEVEEVLNKNINK
jgi:hypothetical protein